MPLTRRQEALLRSLFSRHGRRKSGCCVAEVLRCCQESFHAVPESTLFTLVTPEVRKLIEIPGEVVEVDHEAFGKYGGTVAAQGILAVLKQPEEYKGRPESPFIPVMDCVADPGNMGTIIRTARAAGIRDFWITAGSADVYGDKVVRAALGAQFSMRIRAFASMKEVAEEGRRYGYNNVFLTDPHEGESCFEADGLFRKSLLVIGNEANGIDPEAEGKKVMIPMPGRFESLNAAQAATIFLFEYVRRLTGAGGNKL